MQLSCEAFQFGPAEAKLHLQKPPAKGGDFFLHIFISQDYGVDQVGQILKVGRAMPKRVISATPIRSALAAVKPSSSAVAW
jgi:hypothetical protein